MNDFFLKEKSVSGPIVEVTHELRNDVSLVLSESLIMKAVTICLDMWTNKFRNILYLVATIAFVDSDYLFHRLKLFCRPYTQLDKSALSTIVVSPL